MQQAINEALVAYVAAARAFTHENKVFEMQYHDDADTVEAALAQYNTDEDVLALREAIHALDDEGSDQVLAFLLKHSYSIAHEALK